MSGRARVLAAAVAVLALGGCAGVGWEAGDADDGLAAQMAPQQATMASQQAAAAAATAASQTTMAGQTSTLGMGVGGMGMGVGVGGMGCLP